MRFDGALPSAYQSWRRHGIGMPKRSKLLFPIGVNGVLYTPGCFDERVFDEDLYKRLCPSNDDPWFKTLALLAGCSVVRIPSLHGHFRKIHPETALKHMNVSGGINDTFIVRLHEHFGLTVDDYLKDATLRERAYVKLRPFALRVGPVAGRTDETYP